MIYKSPTGDTIRADSAPEGWVEITEQELFEHLKTRKLPKEESYIEHRKFEYPPAADYLDAVVKDDQAQLDAYINGCKAVKEKYPKP